MTNDNPQPIVDKEVAEVLSEARGHLDHAWQELDHLLTTNLLNDKQCELIETTVSQISEVMERVNEMTYGESNVKPEDDTLSPELEAIFEEEFAPDDPGMRYLQDR